MRKISFCESVGSWILCILAMPVIGSASPFSDDFNGAELNAGWYVISPNPDSSVDLTGTGFLNVTASPKNGGSDLYPGTNRQAPRILQAIDPALDWTLVTKFNFNPTNDYQDAGILLAKTATASEDATDYWRIAARSYYPNGGGNVIRAVGNYVSYTGTTSYLRIEKQGSSYTGWWSPDGTDWNLSGSTVNNDLFPYLGLAVLRQPWDGNTGVYSSADFDYFSINAHEPLVFDWRGGQSPAPTDWGLAANWDPDTDVPDGAGVAVSFGNQDSANSVVDMISAGRTVGNITFASDTGTTIQSTGGFSLTLDNNGSTSTIVVEGTHSITAPVSLNGNASFSGPGTLDLAGGISGPHEIHALNSVLLAKSIQANTLIIGGSAKGVTNISLPEPSTLVLSGMGALGLLVLLLTGNRGK